MKQKTTYRLSFGNLMVKDEESVSFHVESDDYFGTLATIVSLLRDDKELPEKKKANLNEIAKDLQHLQKKYKINKR